MIRNLLYGVLALLLFASVASGQVVLYEFGAAWCGSCKSMAPVVDQLEREGYTVKRVDVEREPAIADAYKVGKLPCFVVVEHGKIVDRVVGVVTAERLRAKLPKVRVEIKKPHPAWRYEHIVGKYTAVVRIECEDSNHGGRRNFSLGSGVLVRWAGKVVVVTARHVIQDAKRITVKAATGKNYKATILRVDAKWDCAVLGLEATPDGIEPADVAVGEDAKLTKGDKLESCGYGGPETKLAVNGGRFIDWRRNGPNGPDDWAVLSGPARQGDSGGPVFNAKGQVVGVLWGTDGTEVVFVQPGRLHIVLQEAFGYVKQSYEPSPQAAYDRAGREYTYTPLQYERHPTPPIPGPEAYQPSGGNAPKVPNYLIPEREQFARDQAQQLATIQAEMAAIRQQLGVIAESMKAGGQADPATLAKLAELQQRQAALEAEAAKAKEEKQGARTIVGKIAEREADWLAEHGGPLSSRIAGSAAEKLDSDSAAVRFVGFTQAKVALLIFCGAVVLVGLLIFYGVHRLNNTLIPKLQEAAAKTSNTYDDKAVQWLSDLHEKVNAVEANAKSRLDELKGKVDTALHVGTAAALATPAAPIAAPLAAGLAAADALKPPTQGA